MGRNFTPQFGIGAVPYLWEGGITDIVNKERLGRVSLPIHDLDCLFCMGSAIERNSPINKFISCPNYVQL